MGVITALKERLMPSTREPAERLPLGRQGLDIKQARKALRTAIAERNQARAVAAQACEQLTSVEGHASACATELKEAERRAHETAEASLAFQREHLARGEIPPRNEGERLAADAADAALALRAAREAAATAETASRDALPGLREKDADAQSRLNRLEETVARLTRAVIRAELDRRMAGIYPALKQVRDFYALAVTVDKAAGIGLSEPDIPIVRCWFAQEDLQRAQRDHAADKWREWARSLREDAEAQLNV